MKKRKSGFTLVELMVYSSILVIFLYIMTALASQLLEVQLESETTSALTEDSRFILNRFSYDIARASSVVQPASFGAQTPTLVLQIGQATYTYAVQNGNLTLTDPTETAALNSYGSSVSNITFQRYGNVNGKPSVRLTFTLTSVAKRAGGAETHDYEATYGTR